jgi:hypothetical protein
VLSAAVEQGRPDEPGHRRKQPLVSLPFGGATGLQTQTSKLDLACGRSVLALPRFAKIWQTSFCHSVEGLYETR